MSAARGELARARSALEAAQSELYLIQTKLAPLRMQERRAVAKLAEAVQRVRALEGADAPARDAPVPRALVDLARLYEGRPCDTEAP